jgi:guanine deaminase
MLTSCSHYIFQLHLFQHIDHQYLEKAAMSGTSLVFQGAVLHSLGLDKLEVLSDATIVVNATGKIVAMFKSSDEVDQTSIPEDSQVYSIPPGDLLIPGFVDTHNHAPQWPMRGQGQGLHILDWLEKVTFPHEARFADSVYARKAYESCVDGFLRQGITTASYYASSHAEATRILADVCLAKGQRALVGKCNMDCNAPDSVRDQSAASSLDETLACIEHIRNMDQGGRALVQPVLTPRFAICCSSDLLRGLGDIAKSHGDIAVQTHFNEAEQEIQATRELFPQFQSECDLYEHFGLLGSRSILAHCTIMTDYEKDRLKALDCGIAHCPIANMTVGGGFMAAPVADFLRRGIKVGLGTDSGGGFSSSMLDSIRQAIIASNYREMVSEGAEKALSLGELFHLATLGGAEVLGLQDRIGNFAVGKDFDAALVSSSSEAMSAMTAWETDEPIEITFEKFLMTGDDRNIVQVYVQGRRVK